MLYELITSKDDCDHKDGENKTHHLDDVHSFFKINELKDVDDDRCC